MFRPCSPSVVEIRATMFGTLAFTIARRQPCVRGMSIAGKLTEFADVAVLEVPAQLLGDHHRAVGLGLVRRGAQVGQLDDLGWPRNAAEGKSVT